MIRNDLIATAVAVTLGVIVQALAFGAQGPEAILISVLISGLPVIVALGAYILGMPFHRSSPSAWMTKDTAGTIKVATIGLFLLISIAAAGRHGFLTI